MPLVYVGNWEVTAWSKKIRKKYSRYPNLILLDPIFDISVLNQIRSNCTLYVHGHSAGGTNPSLVEAMHLGVPLACYDNGYNNNTTHNKALFFKNIEELRRIVNETSAKDMEIVGREMKKLAMRYYCWEIIAKQYYDLFRSKGDF